MFNILQFRRNINYNKKTRFILSFIGGIIYHICSGCCLALGNFNVYLTSFIHYSNSSVDMQYGHLMIPLLAFSLSIFVPIGGILENKIGLHLSLIVSSSLLEIFIFIFINQKNIWHIYILIVLMGLSCGLGIAIPRKNCCFYYPEQKAFILSTMSSLTILIFGIISVVGEKVINPEKVILKKGEKFYPLEVSKNFILFYKYILRVIPIITIISLLLIKKYENDYNINNKNYQSISDKKGLKEKINNNNEEEERFKNKENYSINVKAALFNIRIWKIASIASLSSFALGFSVNTFRVYGALISINGTFMQYSGGIGSIILCICTPIWGYINDNFDFTKIIKIICFSTCIQSLLLSIFLSNNITYIFCILFGCLISCGLMTSINPHIMQVYGIEYTLEIGGIVGICHGIVSGLGAIIAFIISKYYHTGEELQKPYKYLFFIGTIFCIISFYLAFYENNDKFIFPVNINEIKLENIQKEIKKDNLYNNFTNKEEKNKGKTFIQLDNI